MSSFRLLSSATRRATSNFTLARRGYAAEVSDKLKLSLALPHKTLFNSQDVVQVNIPAESGDMGILSNHVPSIEPLRPGVVEVVGTSDTQKFFVSGGFATVHPNNKLTINVIEGAPLDSFSLEAIRANLQEASKVASGNGSEADKTEARIEVEVYEALQHALAK